VYFPRDAVLAILVPMDDGDAVEGATIGNEGMVGLPLFFGDTTSTLELAVLIPGHAARMSATEFERDIVSNPALQTPLQHYALALLNQLARTAACNRIHSVEQRCARWLLMSRDRTGRDTFAVTHETLAAVLGVRRASVTEAAMSLQSGGMITYRRGVVTIRQPKDLEEVACEDYRLSRDGYDQIYL
jgi:CRP-like cAMP-binding protein